MIDLEGQRSPEVHLWRAVVTQAIEDATSSPRDIKPYTRNGKKRSAKEMESLIEESKRNIAQAREWLIKDSKDFRRVCDLAMLDPDAVRDRALSLSRRNWPAAPRRRSHVTGGGADAILL